VEGSIHVPQSAGDIGGRLTADPQIFGRFVSVTGAMLTLPGGAEVEAPVLLVNRDLIAGISVPEERRAVGSSPLVAAPDMRADAAAGRQEGD